MTDTPGNWPETFRKFRHVVAREGVARIAEEIPADRETVYRMLRGDTGTPTRAVRAGIERVVEEHTEKP